MVARNFKIDDIAVFVNKFSDSSIVEKLDDDFLELKQ